MGAIPEKTKLMLENLNENYTYIYILIMSATFIMALDNLLLLEDPVTGVVHLKDLEQIVKDILLFFVFIALFVRFFLGDLRYLDSRYIENVDPKKYTPKNRMIDFISLLIHGVFFYLLSAAILDFSLYYIIFTGVLFFNFLWLVVSYLLTKEEERNITEIKNCKIWAINNFVFVILFVVLFYYSQNLSWKYSLHLFFGLAMFNSIIDFGLTMDTYFPEIDNKPQ